MCMSVSACVCVYASEHMLVKGDLCVSAECFKGHSDLCSDQKVSFFMVLSDIHVSVPTEVSLCACACVHASVRVRKGERVHAWEGFFY